MLEDEKTKIETWQVTMLQNKLLEACMIFIIMQN